MYCLKEGAYLMLASTALWVFYVGYRCYVIYRLEYNGISRNVMEYQGLYWNILEYLGLYWNILEHQGLSMNIKEYKHILI